MLGFGPRHRTACCGSTNLPKTMHVAAWLPGSFATPVRAVNVRPPFVDRATQMPFASTPARYNEPAPPAVAATSCDCTSLRLTTCGSDQLRPPSAVELTTVV